jgi:hypothetical protein
VNDDEDEALDALIKNTNKQYVSKEGDGWLLEYVCELVQRFHVPFDFVWDDLPMVQGWAYYQWAINNDPVGKIFGREKTGLSYVRQEVDKLINEAIKQDSRWLAS